VNPALLKGKGHAGLRLDQYNSVKAPWTTVLEGTKATETLKKKRGGGWEEMFQ